MAYPTYPNGTVLVTVPAGQKLAVYSPSWIKIYKRLGYPNYPEVWAEFYITAVGETYTSAAMTAETLFRVETGPAYGFYDVAIAPSVSAASSDISAGDATFTIAGLAAAQGGYVAVVGGTSSTAGNAGGAVSMTGGVPGATSAGGAASVTGGIGGATSGNGGSASLTGGAGTSGNAAGGAGSVSGGRGQGTGAGGAANVTGGLSGAGATGTGGAANVTGGASAATNGAGGAVAVTGGAGAGTGNGGAVGVTGGASGAGATGNGGAVTIAGGASGATNGNGGNVILDAGARAGSGIPGHVICRDMLITPQGAPTAKTTTAAITASEIQTGIITVTHAAGANQDYALPAGAALDAAMQLAVGDSFAWVLINLSAAITDTATITSPGADHTIVGIAVVQAANAATGALGVASGLFRTRKTAADTFITYRIG